jgi:hypothetical protein
VREQQRGRAEFGDRVVREESPEYVAAPGPFDSV